MSKDKVPSEYASLYTDEERRMLRLNYSLYFTGSESTVRNVANALKGRCRDEAGIIKSYYPYQTPEGRPLKRYRDRSTGQQIWKEIKITGASSLQILKKCLFIFIDHKYGDEPKIEIHNGGDPVEEEFHYRRPVGIMTEAEIQDILSQIEIGKHEHRISYSCCGEIFQSLYEFRRHLHKSHPEEMSRYFEEALHREMPAPMSREEVHRLANKGKKKKEKAQERKEKRQVSKRNRDAYPIASKGDSFHLIYTPMGNKK